MPKKVIFDTNKKVQTKPFLPLFSFVHAIILDEMLAAKFYISISTWYVVTKNLLKVSNPDLTFG